MNQATRNKIADELANDPDVGLCSRKRAEYLMGAAALAGGAVYVGLPLEDLDSQATQEAWQNHGVCYPCRGTIGGEPVADIEIDRDALIAAVRAG